MYRKTSSTRIHIKFCYLIAKTPHSLNDTHTQSTKHSPQASVCRALFCIRGTVRHLSLLYIQRPMPATLHYRERRKHFTISLICVYNNRARETIFTPATDDMPFFFFFFTRDSAIDRNHKRSPLYSQFLPQE